MKHVIKISAILFVYLLLCGKSCVEETDSDLLEEKAVKTERENIRNEVEVAWLTEESKYVSEVGAAQKLTDLADYLEFYTDPSLDSTFRMKAGEMIRELFVSGEVAITLPMLLDGRTETIMLQDLMDQERIKDLLHAEIDYDSILLLDPLQKSGQENYLGRLSCTQMTRVYGPADTLWERSAITVDVVVRRNAKVFGQDTLLVWDVFLGDMKSMK